MSIAATPGGRKWLCLPVILAATAGAAGQTRPATANYDESKVPPYTLPDPLVMLSGERVEDAAMWRARRRPEILELFRAEVYGRSPGRPEGMTFKAFELDRRALDGRATRKQVTVSFTGKEDGPAMDLLMYLPNGVSGPVPVFLVPNFNGNHGVCPDPQIRLSNRWFRPNTPGVSRRTGHRGRPRI
jgi:hypothetical protein